MFGDMLVAGLLSQAEGKSQWDLTGREAILERAKGYASSRQDEIERLLRDIAAKRAELTGLLDAQSANPSLTAVFSALNSAASYFREDAPLKAALMRSLESRLALHSRQLPSNRNVADLMKLRDQFTVFGLRAFVTGDLNTAIDRGVRDLLRTKISGINMEEHRGEAALWGILLGDRERKPGMAVAIKGTTERDGAFLEPLRARIGELLGNAFEVTYVQDVTAGTHASNLLLEIEVKNAGVRTGERTARKPSQYLEGSREEENPARAPDSASLWAWRWDPSQPGL